MLTARRFAAALCALGFLSSGASISTAQDYPNKPIRIVAGAIGGGADFDARQIAPGISAALGQSAIVDNRVASVEIVSRAPPDGYTLLVAGSSIIILPLMQKTLYDPVTDFSPVSVMTRSIDVLVVNSSLPVTSVKELIALAKSKPGSLHYGSGGTAGPPNLSAALFNSMAGIDVMRVPYKGGGPALSGVLAGEVQMMFATASAAMPHAKAGKLKTLGITSAQPSALVPGVPPIASSVPGYESVSMTALFAPAKTMPRIVSRLHQEVVRFLQTPEVRDRFFNFGEEIVGNSPEDFAALMKSEIAKWGRVIKDAHIKVD